MASYGFWNDHMLRSLFFWGHVLTKKTICSPSSGRWRWSSTAATWRICPSALATRASTWSRSLQTCRWQTCWSLERRWTQGIERVDHLLTRCRKPDFSRAVSSCQENCWHLLTFNADHHSPRGQQMQLSLHDPLRVEYVMWKSRRAPNARLEAGTVTIVGGFTLILFWYHPWSSIVHHQYFSSGIIHDLQYFTINTIHINPLPFIVADNITIFVAEHQIKIAPLVAIDVAASCCSKGNSRWFWSSCETIFHGSHRVIPSGSLW